MLTLTVKAGQFVKIGEDIKVCVHKSKRDLLTIGIEAPKEYVILRDKVLDRLEAEEFAAKQDAQRA
jgi:carbon storage regulator CsrA